MDVERFQIDLKNTAVFTVVFITACLVVGLLLAILLDQKIKGEAIFRTIFMFPLAISFIVTGVAWRWLETPSSGINLLFDAAGLGLPDEWLVHRSKHRHPRRRVGRVLANVRLRDGALPGRPARHLG